MLHPTVRFFVESLTVYLNTIATIVLWLFNLIVVLMICEVAVCLFLAADYLVERLKRRRATTGNFRL